MPLVSVIMSAYKEKPNIFAEAVDSVLSQTFIDFEFIIALDAPDNIELRQLIEGYANADSRVRPLFNNRNLGLAESLNNAITHSTGKYICRMDADDISLNDRIERQLNWLTEADADLIGGEMIVVDGAGEDLYVVNNLPSSPEKVNRALRWNNCVPHPTWLGKREIFESGYRCIPLCEDYDLLLRSALAGKKLSNGKGVVLKYRMGEDSISRSNLYDQYLYMRYLTHAYAQGKVVDLDAAAAWVSHRSTESKKLRYQSANESFNLAMRRIEAREFIRAFGCLATIAFTSPAYVAKMFRLVFAALAL